MNRQEFKSFIDTSESDEVEDLQMQVKEGHDDLLDAHKTVSLRWSLSIGLANGASLAALGSKLVGAPISPWTYLFLPSALLFGLGLVSLGATHGISLWRTEHQLRVAGARLAAANTLDPTLWREENEDLLDRLWWIETALELTAGAAFLIGIGYPLLALWIRLMTTGTLAP